MWDREKCAFVFDHYAPTPDVKSADNHRQMREFARKNQLKYHFDTNCGVCHQVMPEAGLIRPGMIVVATDSHTTTHGAFGAMGTGCGATDMATILMTGELWFRIPEIIEVRLEGETKKGVYPKDVILAVLGKIRADGAVYKAIDFYGKLCGPVECGRPHGDLQHGGGDGSENRLYAAQPGSAGLCGRQGGRSLGGGDHRSRVPV